MVGIDVVHMNWSGNRRGAPAYQHRGYLSRISSATERKWVLDAARPDAALWQLWAAKEATYKALSGNHLARAVGWQEIEVCLRDDGAPYLMLHGRAQQRATELGVSRAMISLTHSKSAAVAVVVLEKET